MEYNFNEIERKWQHYWDEQKSAKAVNNHQKPKYYVLDMFPYPSGAGLHVGHPLGFIASDIVSRYQRHLGKNVLHPMGFDAFGLPAEQYAIQTGKHPAETTRDNIARYISQLKRIGFSYDWDRQVTTSDPSYYKWTQWIFLQLFHHWYDAKAGKARHIDELVTLFARQGNAGYDEQTISGNVEQHMRSFTAEEWKQFDAKTQSDVLMCYRLAYQDYAYVNWCEALGTVLANDEVKDGVSERGGHPVERRQMRQWFLRITAYADRLYNDLDTLEWSDSMKDMQRNWIGRSEGCSIDFKIQKDHNETSEVSHITIFTTRPDTIFGVSFMVLAPESEWAEALTTPDRREEIHAYISEAKNRSERERLADVKRVTGVFSGSYAIHPFTGEPVPVWISEYVLAGYGTGAVMAVPAHDSRDFRFARHFNLPVPRVIAGADGDTSELTDEAYEAKDGMVINSDFITGLRVKEAIAKVIDRVEAQGIGKRQVNYRLRDANFSRQRYWGEPFPIYYKDNIPTPLNFNELPLELPPMEDFKPTGRPEGPLAKLPVEQWNHNGYPLETDTMPGFAGSSWYFLRYMDPQNPDVFASQEAMEYWKDVDLYIGGTEHAVGHLLYSRFWHKFLYDLGYVPTLEPFKKLVNQGMIQGVSQKIYFEGYSLNTNLYDINSPEFVVQTKIPLSLNNPSPIFYSADVVERFSTAQKNGTSPLISFNIPIEFVKDGNPDLSKVSEYFNDYPNAVFILNNGTYWSNKKIWMPEIVDDLKGKLIPAKLGFEQHFKTFSEVEKMSKSKYNVVNPDEICETYGADTLRLYEMFLGPIEQAKPWNTNGIEGVHKFLKKLWRTCIDKDGNCTLTDEVPTAKELKVLHKTIKKIREDIASLSMNTCVSAFMICLNELNDLDCRKKTVFRDFIILLSPFAPHIAEELWEKTGEPAGSLSGTAFPEWKQEYLVENTFNYPVSFNGKTRFQKEFALDLPEEDLKMQLLADDQARKYLEGKEPKKVIVVKGRIINVVI